MLLTTCILSGCDYLDSLKGIGFSKAVKLVTAYGTDLESIMKEVQLLGLAVDKANYLSDFAKARSTFKHQVVYDPVSESLVYLNESDKVLDYVGDLEYDQKKYVSTGMINSETKLPILPTSKPHFISASPIAIT